MNRILTTLLCCLMVLSLFSCDKEKDIAVTSVSISQPTAEMVIGETVQLRATVLPADATDKSVIWASSKQTVATVSSSGLVTALAEGNTTITATAGGKVGSCTVTVSNAVVVVSSVQLNKTSLELVEGESETLTATVKPDDADDKTVTWSSSNASVATVDNGKVTALKEGSATITAKAGDKTATCAVVVAKKVIPAESIELNKTTLALIKGASETLVATVKPDDATSEVTWSSSSEAVATVEQDGKVTAVGGGEATITAQAGDKKATCSVTVTVPVESISLDKETLELWEEESVTLTATVLPDDATDKTVTWSSSDASIASVESGKVTGVKEGKAVITAKAGEQSVTCTVSVKHNASAEAIVFADDKVKEKLVAAFDTNGDGELSYGEAAAVKSGDDLKAAFGAIKTYKSFDEFQYFTGVTWIPDSMFEGWISTSIVLPNSIGRIGSSAFKDCTKLTRLIIPEGVTSIGEYAFNGCSSLVSVSIPKSVTRIKPYAFQGCSSLVSVSIPEGVTKIEDTAFSKCSSLTSVFLPKSLISIERFAFYECNSLVSVSIPENVTNINYFAFSGCDSLTSLSIPESVTIIGIGVFNGCSSLKSITLPESMTSIDDSAFQYCSSLTSIIIPKGVTIIRGETFKGCTSLTSVSIPDSVTSIEDGAFCDCSSLTSITLPESVSSMGQGVFSKCSSLTSIILPNSLIRMGGSVFYGCSNLTSVTLSESVTSIPSYTFFGCSSLTSISIPESVSYIWNNSFQDCSSLVSVSIPESVTEISSDAFNRCICLMSITLPENLMKLGFGALYGCSRLTSIIIPKGVTEIENRTFEGCTSLTSVTLHEGITSIGNTAFMDCDKLTSIDIPKDVISIGEGAFRGCSNLTSITLPESVSSIGKNAFRSCRGLISIFVNAVFPPEGGSYMFNDTNNAPIYVPTGSVDTYKTASYWQGYANRIQAKPES